MKEDTKLKTRQGFVSNSSSSSFIVLNTTAYFNPTKGELTEEQLNAIKKHGAFKETSSIFLNGSPFYVEETDKVVNYYTSVTCNQDEVIYFLLENDIPFVASVHYDDETWRYYKGSDSIYVTKNEKIEGQRTEDELKEKAKDTAPRVEVINVKEWMKKAERWVGKEY